MREPMDSCQALDRTRANPNQMVSAKKIPLTESQKRKVNIGDVISKPVTTCKLFEFIMQIFSPNEMRTPG
jgi:hypothetical protein